MLKGELAMADYQELYLDLFREISRIIENLKELQQKMEEKYLAESEKTAQLIVLKNELS
ncbi:MAG: hypothetical protein MJ157_02310 [Clostridia bacterium]|nr:hypothetical protein [Clostridia bacterium]